jgi:hypothetical protein
MVARGQVAQLRAAPSVQMRPHLHQPRAPLGLYCFSVPRGGINLGENMWKIVTAGFTALFITASPLAFAHDSSAGASQNLTAADWEQLTDARIKLVKAALQLTPDQEKYWPAV